VVFLAPNKRSLADTRANHRWLPVQSVVRLRLLCNSTPRQARWSPRVCCTRLFAVAPGMLHAGGQQTPHLGTRVGTNLSMRHAGGQQTPHLGSRVGTNLSMRHAGGQQTPHLGTRVGTNLSMRHAGGQQMPHLGSRVGTNLSMRHAESLCC